MALLLGVDTGGTYTDAVIVDDETNRVLASAKAPTSHRDLALGIGQAIDSTLAAAAVRPSDIALVSLSTTLATNALVEGQGGRVALIAIGFTEADLQRAGLAEALGDDPLVRIAGGHTHAGTEVHPLDLAALEAAAARLGPEVMGFAVAASFATRNPAHETAARATLRRLTGRPVTCSHELSARLNGPKRALTALLNARLIGMIDRLVAACEHHLARAGIGAPLMVVRGDGALVGAALVRERPIETILSGPAASIVGARWLTGASDALVSDIGGTTTDVATLHGGLPEIDPQGALVGGFRTMVEAVAMRTTGLGGDSEVHLLDKGLEGGLRLGPRRLVPVAFLAAEHGEMVHAALDRWLTSDKTGEFDGRFVLPLADPVGTLPAREQAVFERITRPMPLADALTSRLEAIIVDRLVSHGLVMLSGVTPTDASHTLGRQKDWDAEASRKAVRLFARRRTGSGERIAKDADALAAMIIRQLTRQTADCLLEVALSEDPRFAGLDPARLAHHPFLAAGLDGYRGTMAFSARLTLPVIGLGASAPSYYGAVGAALGCETILPAHAGVANAIGAVVGQVSQRVTGTVTSPATGQFVAHLPTAPMIFGTAEEALAALESALGAEAEARARAAGAADPRIEARRNLREVEIEGAKMFVEASVTVTASGRPRVARDPRPLDAPQGAA